VQIPTTKAAVKKTVKDWFSRLAADVYNDSIQKLVT
jgi:hypothetical protein